ncbi:hypothetical protein H7F33_08535 [Pedobacter sp. PAMC26386]|nr:hypothetical protein H7F33_08535 [Pedobacter sp. PAMC26386]
MLRNKYIAHTELCDLEDIQSYITLNYNGRKLEYSLLQYILLLIILRRKKCRTGYFLIFFIKYLIEKQHELTELFFKSIGQDELFKLAFAAGAFENERPGA